MARILIIDDEDLARFTIREFLEGAGHAVDEAINGADGLALQRQSPFDLLITDIIMPEKEGIETIIELRHEFPALPIIAISGGGRTRNLDFLQIAQQMGANRILSKPFTEEELLSAVSELVA